MPRYDFQCACGITETRWLNLFEYDFPQRCKVCGKKMKRLISAPSVAPDWEPFMHPNMGHEPVLVRNRKHMSKLLSERGLQGKYGEGVKQREW